jgi:hypothetical protein
MRVLEVEDVIRLLHSEIKQAGNQAAWSKKARVDRSRVNAALNGRGPLTKSIIAALNLRIVFVSKSKSPHSK